MKNESRYRRIRDRFPPHPQNCVQSARKVVESSRNSRFASLFGQVPSGTHYVARAARVHEKPEASISNGARAPTTPILASSRCTDARFETRHSPSERSDL